MRYDFASDNVAGAAPEAMEALIAANRGFASPYGSDTWSARAADLVRAFLDADADVRFVTSGTAANAIALAALCRPYEAVAAHEHAHIVTDEAGAPAFFGGGFGLTALPGPGGRIDPTALAAAIATPESSYRQPLGALSLTNATEYGAVYDVGQIDALTSQARDAGLGVHLDGARLANAAAAGYDVKSIVRSGVDILILGGAKAGMTGSEAIVLLNKALSRRFNVRLKQSGQLPSKGRFVAAPFVGLLESGAWLRYGQHANAMARRLAQKSPFPVRHPTEANAVFLDIDAEALARINAAGWAAYRFRDGSARFVCSWATTPEAVDEFAEVLTSAI